MTGRRLSRDGDRNADARMVQDDVRERSMRGLFGLRESGEGRMGADVVDEFGNRYELKSATRSGVTTARDVGIHTINRWRTRYWVICRGRNTGEGFIIHECRFLAPSMMEGWLSGLEAVMRRDLDLLQRVIETIKDGNFTDEEIARLEYLVRRGYMINNPKIPWRYIEEYGQFLDISAHAPQSLRRLVERHPLTTHSGA